MSNIDHLFAASSGEPAKDAAVLKWEDWLRFRARPFRGDPPFARPYTLAEVEREKRQERQRRIEAAIERLSSQGRLLKR